jgi:hypothetical protein
MTFLTRDTLRGLAVYALLCIPVHYFLRWYRPQLEGVLPTALLALPLTMALGYVVGARQHLREERLILDATRQTVFRDGARVVAVGPVTPLREAVKSPFTGKECVAYRYVIDREDTSGDGPPTRIRDYWGMALCPCSIETPSGPVRILGWPSLETYVEVLEDKAPADAYVRSTTFRHPTSAVERFGSLKEPYEVESDQFHDDVCANEAHDSAGWHVEVPELTDRDVSEWRVDVGQAVFATGIYSATLKALLPSGIDAQRLRLSTFTPELWASENRDQAYTYLGWGAAFAVVTVVSALATRWC